MPKLDTVLVLENISQEVRDLLPKLFKTVHVVPVLSFTGNHKTALPTDEQYAEADVIWGFIVPSNLKSYTQTPNLKLWQSLSAGYEHVVSTDFYKSIPKDAGFNFATASGIHATPIGEYTLLGALAFYYKLPAIINEQYVTKKWKKRIELGVDGTSFFVREIRTLTVGIVGYGHIGRESGRLFSGLGSTVLALTRKGIQEPETGYIIPGTGDPEGVIPKKYYSSSDPASTQEFLGAVDIVINTLPGGEATQKWFDAEKLKALKGNALFINIGRGNTVDQDALVEALEGVPGDDEAIDATGTLRIGGATLDVTNPEPLPDGHKLLTLPNVIVTPHMSGATVNYFKLGYGLLLENVTRYNEGKDLLNILN